MAPPGTAEAGLRRLAARTHRQNRPLAGSSAPRRARPAVTDPCPARLHALRHHALIQIIIGVRSMDLICDQPRHIGLERLTILRPIVCRQCRGTEAVGVGQRPIA